MVGLREPCPCGSGRRYKACHGRGGTATDRVVLRPFAGLPSEPEWVALREVVPAATAPLTLVGEAAALAGDRPVTLATVLPMAWAAMSRADGSVFLGLQVPARSGDLGRDLAAALITALEAPPGTPVPATGMPGPGPRLPELVGGDALAVTVHEGFEFWLDGVDDPDERAPDVAASMARANAQVVPTQRLPELGAAYWCRIGERTHLRWALPYDEEPLLDALARLAATGNGLRLLPGDRYVGSFRAHGLLVPVWDLPDGAGAADVAAPAAAFGERLAGEMAAPRPLEPAERRLRAGLLGRQLTLR